VLSRLSSEQELKWWLTLWRVPSVSSAVFRTLYQHYQTSPQIIFTENDQKLLQLGVTPKGVAAIRSLNNKPHAGVDNDLAWLAKKDHHLLHEESDFYPPLLKETVSAPALLFVEGNIDVLLTPQIGIVGSRNASTLGKETAFDFAKQLSRRGLTVTSGLALGIDTYSHEGALTGGGKTIAVLGTGADVIYPRQNKKLAQEIIEKGGAIISEAPLGTAALPQLFPRRNRIISGLSLGVLVVEAALKSGSLITARLAAEQGREVFAIPGSIHNVMHKGCHQLIRDGATLIETADDIVSSLNSLAQFQFSALQQVKEKNNQLEQKTTIDVQAKKLLDEIGFEPTPVDMIIARSNLSPADVSRLLMSLELSGWISIEAGGYMKTSKIKETV
jgi:DNA processing protein